MTTTNSPRENAAVDDAIADSAVAAGGDVGRVPARRTAFVILIALTLFSAVAHGLLNGRWSVAAEKTAIGDQFSSLPEVVGDWRLVHQDSLDEQAAEMLRCYGSDIRSYRHAGTGAIVNAAIFFGPRGPIAVHTPEVCYSGAGTEQTRPRREETVAADSVRNKLWSVEFSQNREPTPSLQSWYAWSDGGPWVAAKYPRVWMTDDLYKIQIAGPIATEDFDPCADFLASWLPIVKPLLR
ncbi:hypothetical protein K227x_47030 [Rubripirellula lacrimiformis]|uniref:Methanolan biosynthesis EpsI domain-containing protein n=1 Tax=Rubripirellula lacrimiformis TaxID=1930273 RepID=A0A517NGN7_9BACT|nr:exosortase-associated EpsI family protein [Rubripirellula lacrimiformis]QDT06294.1 hypothetical protein K227x_47030 [Rubripirellula lacrimiformis]